MPNLDCLGTGHGGTDRKCFLEEGEGEKKGREMISRK